MGRLIKACPLLPASDVRATADWYKSKLGFSIRFANEEYAILYRDEIELHLWPCADRSKAENTSVYIRVEDIGDLRAKFAAAAEGGRISDIQCRDWGMLEFYIWDPAGNLLRFGRPVDAAGNADFSTKDLLDAFARLPSEEQQRHIEYAAAALRLWHEQTHR